MCVVVVDLHLCLNAVPTRTFSLCTFKGQDHIISMKRVN